MVPPEWSSWWRISIHRQLPRPFHWFDLVRESPIGDRWPYSGANDRVGSRIPTRRLPTPHALLVDFQHRGNLRGADPYSDLCQDRWPFSFRWRMCHLCSTSRTGRALDDPHYLPGLHRESISQGVISCQWRLDPAGNTGGGLHSLVPRSVGNSDITPNIFQRSSNEASPGSSS